jgi:CBS domain-containing membrane protein
MNQTKKPLLALTASDLMNVPVVVLPKEISLQAAAHKLLEADVHGAPVVDDQDRCVGVLSTMDFLYWAEETQPIFKEKLREKYFSPWQIVEPSQLPTDSITHYMTPNPVMAPPSMPITELARKMLDAHIHRLFVVQEQGRPIGIVSCTDIMRAVAHAELMQ